MKRRFMSLALCIFMVLTMIAVASCTSEEAPNTSSDDSGAKTITIWGIKGEGTTDEAVAAVEAAMSKITELKLNTAIKLNLYFEDEYDAALEARLDEIETLKEAQKEAEREARKNKDTTAEEEETSAEETGDETVLDEYGLPITVYPEVEDDQLDIFLITDYEMLRKYNDKRVLSYLDDELSGDSKIMKSYIHPTFISAGKINGKTVALINQQMVGEATYMLVNRELLAKYYYHIDDIADTSVMNRSVLTNALNFILDVKREEPDYQPFVGDPEPINVYYFTLNGEKSVFGHMLPADAEKGEEFEPRHMLFQNPLYVNYLKTYMTLKNNDCFGSETFTAEDKFGVGIIKGTSLDVAPFEEDYHIITLQAPQGTPENIYNGMFAVSTYTTDLARSMEVLTYLNTKSDLRNLFGYGIEGEHYTVDEEGVIDIISEEYNMKLEYTGNCFVAYPPEGQPANYWDAAKYHNIELVLSPFFMFELTEDMIDMELYNAAIELSNSFFADLEGATSDSQVSGIIKRWAKRSDDSEEMNLWVEQFPEAENEDEDPPKTLGAAYYKWFQINK